MKEEQREDVWYTGWEKVMDCLENRTEKKKSYHDLEDNTIATTPHPEQWRWSSAEIAPEFTDVVDPPSAASQPSAGAAEIPSPPSRKAYQDAWDFIQAGWSSTESKPVGLTALEGPGNTLHGHGELWVKQEIVEEEYSNDFPETELAAAGLSVAPFDTQNTNHLHRKEKRKLATEDNFKVSFDIGHEDSFLPSADTQEVCHQQKSKNTRKEGRSVAEVLTMLDADHLATESGQTRTQRSPKKKKRQKNKDTSAEPFTEEPLFTSGNSISEPAVAVHQLATENETEETEGRRKYRKQKKKKKEETESAENNMEEQCVARQHDVTASEMTEAGQSRKRLKKKKKDKGDAVNSFISDPVVTANQLTPAVCDPEVADEVRNHHKKKKKKKTKCEEMDAVVTESGTDEPGGIRKHHKKKKTEEMQAAEDSMEGGCSAVQCGVTASEMGEAVQSRKCLKEKKNEGSDIANSFVLEPSVTAQQSNPAACDAEVSDDTRNHHKKHKKKKKKLKEMDSVEETCVTDQHSVMAIKTADMGESSTHCKKQKKKREMNSAGENIAGEPSLSTQGFVSPVETRETGTPGSLRKKNKRRSKKTESSGNPTAHGSSTLKTVEQSKENVPASQAKKKKLERQSDNLSFEDFTPSQEERKWLEESRGNGSSDELNFCPSGEEEESRESSLFKMSNEIPSCSVGISQSGKSSKSNKYISRSVSNRRVYRECYICQEKVDSIKHYIKHLCEVHDKAALQCPKCGSGLLSETLLEQHLKSSCRLKCSEIAIRSFHCMICPMSYTLHSNCLRHLRIEHGLGTPIKASCEICGKVFSMAYSCRLHQEKCREGTLLVAGRGEGLECPQCGKLYASRQSLYYHTRTLHAHHVFECLCGKMFRTSSMYYTHKHKCAEHN